MSAKRAIVAAVLTVNSIIGLELDLPFARADTPQPAVATTAPTAATQPGGGMDHVHIDRQHGWVDLDATVVLREAEWLELLACSPRSREHESILTISARPSHIHLALVILGMEPGAPMKWWRVGDEVKWSRPKGPRVAVTLLYDKDGKQVEVPANEWVLNQKTHQILRSNTWLFAGSELSDLDGQRVYHADLNGTVLSLVNFGDDVLTRDTDMTNNNDEETWGVNTKAIPPLGTKVIVRLKPLEKKAAATQAAGKQ